MNATVPSVHAGPGGRTLREAQRDQVTEANEQPDVESEALLAEQIPGGTPNEANEANVGREAAGQVIDRYKLLEELGEGGMGTVWMAQQSAPVKRRVALKVIKLGMDTREVVARFAVERQALALMDHAHIAKVLDAGATEAGRPYFVMELVRGVPITEFCDQSKFGLAERLELFSKVCHAIQHAHHKGIIHRDVKPSNILISLQDGEPQPKVIDFGIAKATSGGLTQETLYTQHSQVIGTPEYMAPEQAAVGSLDIDTRADVYALGVLLYELLTGTRPFDLKKAATGGYNEMLRVIREEDPAKPSTRISSLGEGASSIAQNRRVDTGVLNKHLRGDLDWIVMKALEKDRARRYETASALAEDIANYLNGEAVDAAPPSACYRLKKLLRRRRKTVISLTTIGLLLIAGSVGTGIGWWKTTQANKSLDTALEQKADLLRQEEKQRLLAEASEVRARSAESEAVREAERATTAEAATQARADELEQVAAFQAEQLSELDVRLMGVRMRAAMLEATPEERRAGLDAYLSELNFTSLALDTLRDNLFDRTIEAIDTQFADQPLVRAKLLQTTGGTWRDLGLLEIALDPQRRALSIRRQHLGDEHPETLSSINDLGFLLLAQGKPNEAEPHFRGVLAVRRRALGDEHPLTLISINNLAGLCHSQGRFAEAEPLLREALIGHRRVQGDEHPSTLNSINGLGLLLKSQGKLTEADSFLQEALMIRRRVLGDEHPDTLSSINSLGSSLFAQGRFGEAERLYREGLASSRRTLGDEHRDTLDATTDLGGALISQGKLAEVEPMYREALAVSRRVLGDEHPDTLRLLTNMGALLYSMGDLTESELHLRESVIGKRELLGDDHPTTQNSINNLVTLLRKRLSSSRTTGTELQQGEALASLGSFLLGVGQHQEASGLLSEAVGLLSSAVPTSDARPWQCQFNLALAIAGLGHFDKVEGTLDEDAQWLLEHGEALAAVAGHTSPKTAGDVLQAMVNFYAAWHAAKPDEKHDDDGASWQVRLDAWNAKSDMTENG